MSLQSAGFFWGQANTDLMARVMGAKDNDAVRKLAMESGFDFTAEEFKQIAVESRAANELTVARKADGQKGCGQGGCGQGGCGQGGCGQGGCGQGAKGRGKGGWGGYCRPVL